MITLLDILMARRRLAPHLTPSLLEAAPGLPGRVWLKLENTNPTHSFKIRGALNAVLALDDAARARGLVTASSGNHAQGLAYAAHLTGARAQILMPAHTPQRKVDGVRRYGADAVLWGEGFDQAEAEARRREHADRLTFVSPYNDPHVIAGAGTIALEIIDALPHVERVVVCVSGGGLIAGIGTAIRAVKPSVEVVGVNAQSAPAMYNHYHRTDHPETPHTLAEALSGGIEPGSITLQIVPRVVDRLVMVDEAAIAHAIRWLLDVQGWLVEGGGAVGVAAWLSGALPPDDRPTAIIVSGGNIDGSTLRACLRDDA